MSKIYACSLCKKTFASFNNLDYHARKHKRAKFYACHRCDFTTPMKKVLEYHQTNRHRKYECSFPGCTYSTNEERLFKKHSKIKHLKCSSCDFAAFSRATLNRHKEKCHADINDINWFLTLEEINKYFKYKKKPLLTGSEAYKFLQEKIL